MKKVIGTFFISLLLLTACSEDDSSNGSLDDNFNRQEMLTNIADNIIIPAYESFEAKIVLLESASNKFTTTPDTTSFENLKLAWADAYRAWQRVSMFQIGKAESLAFSSFMNSYPVDTENILNNLTSGQYNLTAVSKQDEQGFGALDYLLNGLAADSETNLSVYTDNTTGTAYKNYVTDVVQRMATMTKEIVVDWKTNFRDDFIANNGSSATSSFNKLVNDYIFHYERNLRAGKIGIPAGIFSGESRADKIEAYYDGTLSKELFLLNLQAMQDFFNGNSFGTKKEGPGFNSYLRFLNTLKNGENLGVLINNQFNAVKMMSENLKDNLSEQVKSNNKLMLNIYDELQKNVILLKADMLSAMSVSVDFVDADGD
ncbi:imelysin family protein [Aquimarina sp. ERC-38]|uniref:imelysin family protein n=1 Tax=Aquimarina sp. ERC-38 TaxID=2949996 RepID=UPI002247757B|nr:imelysin family protein [Aquimarina sp. ERC-38]UZO80430.1 imelysin family protein [Aquimarina sp. ERC-38]